MQLNQDPFDSLRSKSPANTESFYSAYEDLDSETDLDHSTHLDLIPTSHSINYIPRSSFSDDSQDSNHLHQQQNRSSVYSSFSISSQYQHNDRFVNRPLSLIKNHDSNQSSDSHNRNVSSALEYTRSNSIDQTLNKPVRLESLNKDKNHTVVSPVATNPSTSNRISHLQYSESVHSTTSSDSSLWTTSTKQDDKNDTSRPKSTHKISSFGLPDPYAVRKLLPQFSPVSHSTSSSSALQSVSVKRSISTLHSKSSDITISTIDQHSPNSSYTSPYDNDIFNHPPNFPDSRKNSTDSFQHGQEHILYPHTQPLKNHDTEQHNYDDNNIDQSYYENTRRNTSESNRSKLSLSKRLSTQAIHEFLKYNSSDPQKKYTSKWFESSDIDNMDLSSSSQSSFKDDAEPISPNNMGTQSYNPAINLPSSQSSNSKITIDDLSAAAQKFVVMTPSPMTTSDEETENGDAKKFDYFPANVPTGESIDSSPSPLARSFNSSAPHIDATNMSPEFVFLNENHSQMVPLSELGNMDSSNDQDINVFFPNSLPKKNVTEGGLVHNLPGAPKIFIDQNQAHSTVSSKNELMSPKEQQQRKDNAAKELAAQFSLAMSRLPPLPGVSSLPSSSLSSPITPSFSLHDGDNNETSLGYETQEQNLLFSGQSQHNTNESELFSSTNSGGSSGNSSNQSTETSASVFEQNRIQKNDSNRLSYASSNKIQNRLSQSSLPQSRLAATMLPPLPVPPSVDVNNQGDRLTTAEIDAMVENGDDVQNLHPLASKKQNRLSQNRYSAEIFTSLPSNSVDGEKLKTAGIVNAVTQKETDFNSPYQLNGTKTKQLKTKLEILEC